MERLDPRAAERVSGPSWNAIRPLFSDLHCTLVGVAPTVRAELTTIYIKYTAPETANQPFAVVWVKKSTELVIGLALPPNNLPAGLTGPPAGFKYAGLTGYFKLTPETPLPEALSEWAALAFAFLSAATTKGEP